FYNQDFGILQRQLVNFTATLTILESALRAIGLGGIANLVKALGKALRGIFIFITDSLQTFLFAPEELDGIVGLFSKLIRGFVESLADVFVRNFSLLFELARGNINVEQLIEGFIDSILDQF